MDPTIFSRRFLGLTELQAFPLFYNRMAYGIPATGDLKLEHVIAKFEDIVRNYNLKKSTK